MRKFLTLKVSKMELAEIISALRYTVYCEEGGESLKILADEFEDIKNAMDTE